MSDIMCVNIVYYIYYELHNHKSRERKVQNLVVFLPPRIPGYAKVSIKM